MFEVDKAARTFAAVGTVAYNGSNGGLAGQDTYLVRTSDWFAWDGKHPDHAAQFATEKLAMAAALSCPGPSFRMPRRNSIHTVETLDGSAVAPENGPIGWPHTV
jgi:hypothetical protein